MCINVTLMKMMVKDCSCLLSSRCSIRWTVSQTTCSTTRPSTGWWGRSPPRSRRRRRGSHRRRSQAHSDLVGVGGGRGRGVRPSVLSRVEITTGLLDFRLIWQDDSVLFVMMVFALQRVLAFAFVMEEFYFTYKIKKRWNVLISPVLNGKAVYMYKCINTGLYWNAVFLTCKCIINIPNVFGMHYSLSKIYNTHSKRLY